MITPLYAAILALILVVLSVQTIRLRRRFQVAVGAGDEPLLERAMRVHANFCEYVPIAVVLLFFFERLIGAGWWVHALGVLLVAGRILHAYGVRRVDEDLRLRVTGMSLTFLVLLATSASIIGSYLF